MASLPCQATAVTGPPGSFIRVAPWLHSVSPRTARIFFGKGVRWQRGSVLTPAVSSHRTEDRTHRLSVAEEGRRPASGRPRARPAPTPQAPRPAHPSLHLPVLYLTAVLHNCRSAWNVLPLDPPTGGSLPFIRLPPGSPAALTVR